MENEKHRNYSFQKLTPYEKADMEGYDQSLSFAFQKGNEDLRNIAVTGNYGSGKSSVIRSYHWLTLKEFLEKTKQAIRQSCIA